MPQGDSWAAVVDFILPGGEQRVAVVTMESVKNLGIVVGKVAARWPISRG